MNARESNADNVKNTLSPAPYSLSGMWLFALSQPSSSYEPDFEATYKQVSDEDTAGVLIVFSLIRWFFALNFPDYIDFTREPYRSS